MALTFLGPEAVPVSFRVNGRLVQVNVEPRRTLLSVLREELGLTGAKLACGRAECGACTVIVNGETAYSCMLLAVDCADQDIRTIEGLAQEGQLDPVQESFLDHDAYQCGFCTPGQEMAAVAFLEKNSEPSLEEIERAMSGNICRCGAYANILRAVLAAAHKR